MRTPPRLLVVDDNALNVDILRTRLAAQLSTDLTGITFVLDEPGTGLHPADKAHLLDIAQELAGRIGVIGQGRLIGCGTLDTLRRQAALDGSLEEVFLKLTEEPDAEGA